MSFAFELQKGIYTALNNASALTSQIVAIYDSVPAVSASESESDFPYVVIGDDSITEWDTDTELGFEAVVTVHVWSRYDGMKETKDIQGAIYDALNRATITVTGYTVIDIYHLDSDAFIDEDGFTRHGISKFNIRYQTN